MPTNFYDVIVLGDDLAGLIGAALCARRGLRVLVIETAETPPEKYAIGPYTLPRAPLPFPCEPSPAVRRVVAELSFIQSLKRRLQPLRPAFQIVLPDARLDVSADVDALGREVDRELPGDRELALALCARAAEVGKLLDPVLGQDISLPPEGFWERRELKYTDAKLAASAAELLPGAPAGHPVHAIAALPAAFTLATDPRATHPAAALRAFDLWRRAGALLQGGRDTLRQMLVDNLRTQHAGEVRRVVPGGLPTRWGRIQGVTLQGREETLGAQALLCARPVAELGDLLGGRWPKRLLALSRAIRPTAYRYVLNLVLAEAGVPAGIAPVVFAVVDPTAPLVGDNAFALYVGEPDDDARVLCTVVANAPAPGDGENLEDILAALRRRLLRRVEEVMPFYADHLLCVHSPNQARPPEGLDVDARDTPPVIAPEPLWSSELPAALGVGALPYDLGIKGVTAAAAQNLPGLGLEGEFTAGWCAARLVSGAAGRKRDYLKDEVLLGG